MNTTVRINTTEWFLEELEDTVKYIDNLRFSQYTPDIAHLSSQSILLPGFAFCAILAVVLMFYISKHPKRSIKPSESLQALFTVIVPTSVAWPSDYARLVDHSVSTQSKTVAISMSSFIGAVCDGSIEVRNHTDLPELFSEKLIVYGWRITLALESSWNLAVLRWVVSTHFSWTQATPTTKPRALKRAHGTSIPKANVPSDLIVTSNAHLDLDYICFSDLETSLHQFRATLVPGAFATLEFTTPAAHVTFLSTQFAICAVPFLAREHTYSLAVGPRSRNRTATPLLVSMHRVLELLTAGPSAPALESVSNVSRKYADTLKAAAGQLEDDRTTRRAFILQYGVAGWREQRLMLAWEAALFSAEHLTRWVVVVRK